MTNTETWLAAALVITLTWTAAAWVVLLIDASPISRRETNLAFVTGPLVVAIALVVFTMGEIARIRRALVKAWRDR